MKLNKKGFTLIELLAVIAILAILIVIAVPGVLNMYNSGKKSTFESQSKSLWKSIETAIISDGITGKSYNRYCFDGKNHTNVTWGRVDLTGTTDVHYKAQISGGVISSLIVEQVNSAGEVIFRAQTPSGNSKPTIDSLTIVVTDSTNSTATIDCAS